MMQERIKERRSNIELRKRNIMILMKMLIKMKKIALVRNLAKMMKVTATVTNNKGKASLQISYTPLAMAKGNMELMQSMATKIKRKMSIMKMIMRGCHRRRITKEMIDRCSQASKLARQSKSQNLEKWLPFEIVETDILPRLPVKSLVRFRSVCRRWCSLTYDPLFVLEQLKRAPVETKSSILFYPSLYPGENMPFYNFVHPDGNGSGEIQDRSFDFKFGHKVLHSLSNSVNGLICAFCGFRQKSGYGFPYLFNPALRQLLQLPEIGNEVVPESVGSESLVLGFDDTSGQYKLVRSYNRVLSRSCGFQILTVGTQEWRYIGEAPTWVNSSKALFLNGALHWTVFRAYHPHPLEIAILVFDIKDEKFRFISVPHVLPHPKYMSLLMLRKLEGHVCLVQNPIPPQPNRRTVRPFLKIWKLRDYANHKWKLQYIINMSRLEDETEFYLYTTHIIDIIGGKILMQRPNAIYSYDAYSKALHTLRKFNPLRPRRLDVLTETLIWPSISACSP